MPARGLPLPGIFVRTRYLVMNTHTSHTKAIRAQLLESMRTGEYAGQERLRSEERRVGKECM